MNEDDHDHEGGSGGVSDDCLVRYFQMNRKDGGQNRVDFFLFLQAARRLKRFRIYISIRKYTSFQKSVRVRLLLIKIYGCRRRDLSRII